MNSDRIKNLLDNYWLCNTSVQEEEELRQFFTQDNLPADLIKYKTWFDYQIEERNCSLGSDFNANIIEKIKTKHHFRMRRILNIAASIILVTGLWYVMQPNAAQKQVALKDEIITSPEEAYKETKDVLLLISQNINVGEDMLIENMKKMESLTTTIIE
ncbi:MAG: hypothetical protein LBM07_00085 [Culturomica sp.]|jgi:hypothetical protein|nr:hypothetical protein [Culturomica sp.]